MTRTALIAKAREACAQLEFQRGEVAFRYSVGSDELQRLVPVVVDMVMQTRVNLVACSSTSPDVTFKLTFERLPPDHWDGGWFFRFWQWLRHPVRSGRSPLRNFRGRFP